MEEKEKVLEQIDNINSSFLDIEKFIPLSPNSFIIWGIVSIFLYLGAVPKSIGYFYWFLLTVLFIITSYIIHLFLTKKEMKKYNLTKYSKTQLFIEYVFVITIFIGILLTHIFNDNNIWYYGLSSWVFLIGFNLFITGYVINNSLMNKTGLMMVIAGIIMFIIMSTISAEFFCIYMRIGSALFGGVSLVWLGIMMKKNAKF